jgi:HAD superfamily hydrolase (TIGR01509 family)
MKRDQMMKTIIFDMDGTIIDSDSLVLKIYDELICQFHPFYPLSSISKEDLLSNSYIDNLKRLYETVLDEHLTYVKKLFNIYYPTYLKLFPNTIKMLDELKKNKISIFLVTSEIKEICHLELDYLEIKHYFDEIITYDDVVNKKPNPEGLLKLINQYHLNIEECLFVGDQKSDFIAGKQAHMKTGIMLWNSDNENKHLFDYHFYHWDDMLNFAVRTNKPFVLHAKDDDFKIMQITDLHLMKNEKDELTLSHLSNSIKKLKPDMIISTGDLTMSKNAVMLYRNFSLWIDQFEIPWTFIFGNHDTEFHIKHKDLIEAALASKWLHFEQGPLELGFSNMVFEIIGKNDSIIQRLILLDSHVDSYYQTEEGQIWGFGSISMDQKTWVLNHLSNDTVKSMIFLHIPIPEFHEIKNIKKEDIIGNFLENPSTPPYDCHFFETLNSQTKTQAIFCGHDHYNDYELKIKNIYLVYGRVSGHYDYFDMKFDKGVRIIQIHKDQHFSTQIYLYKNL